MDEPRAEKGSPKDPAETLRTIRRMKIAIAALAVIAAALALFIYIKGLPPPAHKYDAFAKCIAATQTKFYGAWWCPHCQAQKKDFGTGAEYLPYVECANSDTSEKQSCIDLGIKSYPTWVYPDGSTSTGETSLSIISQKTGCPLPTST